MAFRYLWTASLGSSSNKALGLKFILEEKSRLRSRSTFLEWSVEAKKESWSMISLLRLSSLETLKLSDCSLVYL